MSMELFMGFIDCDTHVTETDATWDYFDPKERLYRPRLVNAESSDRGGAPAPKFWLAGDTWTRRVPDDGNIFGNGNTYSQGTITLDNPAARLQDMDALGIDAQVLISTFWIAIEIDHPIEEAALCRSYNRWMAERLTGHTSRLPWLMRVPFKMHSRAIEEMEFGKANGAVGIQFRGVEHGMYLSDPAFYPIYERAQDLDLTIAVHVGTATRRTTGIPVGKLIPSPPTLLRHLHDLMSAFHAVTASDLHLQFPRLKFVFLEGGASWVPSVVHTHARLQASAGEFMRVNPMSADEIASKNIFVACEGDEDIDYLLNVVGDDVLCAGSDYGHNDAGTELGVHTSILGRADISANQARRIVDGNGRRLFGISPDFRPAPDMPKHIDPPHVFASKDGGRPLLVVQSGAADVDRR